MSFAMPSWMDGNPAREMPATPLVDTVHVARLKMGRGATGVVIPADVTLTKPYDIEKSPAEQNTEVEEAGPADAGHVWKAVLKVPRWKMTRFNSLDRARRFLLREEACYNLVGGGGGCVLPSGQWIRDGPPLCFGMHATKGGKTGLLLERVYGTSFGRVAAAWIKEDKLTKRQHKQYKKEQVARIKRGGVGEHATAPAMPLLRKEEKRWRLQLKVAQLGVRLIRVLQCFHKHGIVHSDLSPGNVFYSYESDRIYVMDFGHGCADYINAVPKKDSRGGMRHYVSVRKHADPDATLHPADDFEGALYLMMAALNEIPWFPTPSFGYSFESHKLKVGSGAHPRRASPLMKLLCTLSGKCQSLPDAIYAPDARGSEEGWGHIYDELCDALQEFIVLHGGKVPGPSTGPDKGRFQTVTGV